MRWEYDILRTPAGRELGYLQEAAALGWELVAVQTARDGTTVLYIRRGV